MSLTYNKAVFLDRDGVINKDLGYVYKIDEFEFYDDVFGALKKLKNSGYLLVIITNQSGIARGLFTENQLLALHEYMLKVFRQEGIVIDAIYYCPHHPIIGKGIYKQKCKCRKPEPGMLLEASKDLNISLKDSFVIGDKITDIEAGKKVNCKTILLQREKNEKFLETEGIIVTNLNEAVDLILGNGDV